jgi:hypothetical protein
MDAAPQQFANGGAVQPVYMADAGDPSLMKIYQAAMGNMGSPTRPSRTSVDLQSTYDQYLPFFQNIAQSNEEEREKDRALALAKAGFQFASGRDASGKNIAGQPFLSQLGAAGSTLVGDLAKLKSDERAQDRAIRTLAAQSAIEKQQAATAAEAALDLQMLKGQQALQEKNLGLIGDMFKQAQIQNKVEVRTIKRPDGTEAVGVYNPADNTFKLVSDRTAADQYMMSLDSDGSMRAGISKNLIGFADGTLDGLDDGGRTKADVFTAISTLYAPKSGAEKGTVNPMPLTVAKAIVDRKKAGLELNINEKIIDEAEYLMGNTGAALEQRMKDLQAEGAQTEQDLRPYVPAGADIEASFGAMSGLKRSLRFVNDQVKDITEGLIGFDYSGDDPSNVVKSDTYLTTLQGETLKLRFADFGSAPRIKSIVEAIQAEVAGILPGAGRTDDKVLSTARALRNRLSVMQAELQGVLASRSSTNKEIKEAQRLLKYDMPVLLESYDNLIDSLSATVEGARDRGVPPLTREATNSGQMSDDAQDFQNILQGKE